MTRGRHVSLAVILLALATSACTDGTPGPQRASPKPVTEQQATEVLAQVAAQAPMASAHAFCAKNAYSQTACEDAWKETMGERCLKPDGTPRVLRSAEVPNTKTSDGGRVLLIEGRTTGGHRYVSEFFVTAPQGKPMADIGVYWSGWGLDNSPLGEGHKVLPKSECT